MCIPGATGVLPLLTFLTRRSPTRNAAQNETPPIIPKIRDPLDLSQYREIEQDEEAVAGGAGASSDHDNVSLTNPFVGFNVRTMAPRSPPRRVPCAMRANHVLTVRPFFADAVTTTADETVRALQWQWLSLMRGDVDGASATPLHERYFLTQLFFCR